MNAHFRPSVPADPIRVLVADRYPLIREGLVSVLHKHGSSEVVGQEGDAAGAIDAWVKLKPDVMLLDWKLENAYSAAIIEVIRTKVDHRARIVMFSALKEDKEIVVGLRCGAVGYIDKESTPQEIVTCIERVHGGHRYLAQRATDALTMSLHFGGLTERERQIIKLLGRSKSNAEIAANLRIAESTVKGHMRRGVFVKLNARNRDEALSVAIECGLVSPPAALD